MPMLIKRIRTLFFALLLVGVVCSTLFVGAHRAYAAEQKKDAYLIKINRSYNTITVYAKDKNGKYTKPIRVMLCSVGKNNKTRLGTFQTQAKYRWKLLMNDVWGQYSTRINGGMLFHSVYYYDNNPATLATKEYNKLGTAASHGCVRLTVKDAKWIYDNCSLRTTVTIYDDKKSPGPLGKPKPIKIPSHVRWDPTDPNKKNPYTKKKPVISGIVDKKVKWNQDVDLLKNVKAKSTLGANITSRIKVSGDVDVRTPGVYQIKYSVKDELDKSFIKRIKVTVDKNKVKPSFTGIKDKIVGANAVIDEKFASKGIKAYCSGYTLPNDLVKIKIKQKNETLYYITYQASVGKGPTAEKKCKIIIDNLPPVISGVRDLTIKEGEVPKKETLVKDIKLSDNYSKPDKIKLNVAIVKNFDGSFQVTYQATDEVGNTAVAECKIKILQNPSPTPTVPVSATKFSLKQIFLTTLIRQISNNYILKI